jgi:SSS family solute:Na+ symporter/sodium/proline symporter
VSIYIWAIVVYLAVMIGISLYRSRKIKTQDDFMVAGRSVSALFLVGTLVCTWIGSGSLFGVAGRAFRQGFSALWMSAGAWVGIAIVYFLAHRVRRISEYTVPDILEKRYNAPARVLGTIAIIVAYLTIASYQFIGGSRLLNIVAGVDVDTGKAIIAGLVVVYTMAAGMMSIVVLDLINGILITVGVLIAAPLALHAAGGWDQLTTTLPATHFTVTGATGIGAALGLFFPTFFLLLGESGMYQKFMSARDAKTARRAVIGMIVGVIVVETVLDATAVFGAGTLWNDAAFRAADGSLIASETETVILVMANSHLPAFAGILLLVGAVAIIFSTANTFLMIPSTNLARDIYQRFVNPEVSEKGLILFQRLAIVGLAGVSFLLTTQFTSILDMALYAYTMVGAAVTPALLAAFLWKRVTPLGGMVSVAAGMIATVVFAGLTRFGMESLNFGLFQLPLQYDYIIYPAGLASIVCLVGVSLATPHSPEEKWKPFWVEEPGSD